MKKVLIILALVLLVSYGPILINNQGILIYWGDGHEQIFYFIINSIQNFQSFFSRLWDMNLGLGGSIFSHIFNGLFSPFNLITSLIPGLPMQFLPIFLDIIRFIVVSILAYVWLSQVTINERARITGSIMTVFSGWVMTNLHLSFFQDAYVLMVMILYFSERLLKDKDGLFFAVSLSTLIIINPYFAYMFSFYLLIYLTFRFIIINQRFDSKVYINKIITFLKYYGLGLLLGMFVLLPFIQIVINNPRIGQVIDSSFILPKFNRYNLYLMFTSLLSPVLNDFDANQFISKFNPNISDSLLFQPFVFSFHIFLVMFVNSFWLKYKHKNKLYIFMIFIYLITLFPITYLILNGNIDFRWSFFITFSNILFTVMILEQNQIMNYKYQILNMLILVSVYLCIGYYSLNKNLMNPAYIETLKINLFFSILFIVFYGLGGMKFKFSNYIWVILLFFEAIFVLNNRMYFNAEKRYIDDKDFNLIYVKDLTVFEELKNIDNGFYRIDTTSLPANYPIVYDYNGFTFYSSLYNSELRSLMNNRFSENWKQGYLPSKMVIKNLLGAKYYLTKDEKEVPFGYSKYLISEDWVIYKNEQYIELGFATTNTLTTTYFNQYSKAIQDYVLYQTVVQSDEGNTINFDLPILVGKDLVNGKVEGDFSDGYLLFDYSDTIPFSSCKLDFYNSNEIIETKDIYEYGYYMHKINNGYDKVYAYCTNNYNSSEFTSIDVYHVELKYLKQLYESVSQFDSFTNTTFTNNTIESQINITKNNSYVFTSIPYDEDWVVYANGKKIDKIKVNDGFVGFVLNEGKHQIIMKYKPKMFIVGFSISIISIIGTIIVLIKKRLTFRLFVQ